MFSPAFLGGFSGALTSSAAGGAGVSLGASTFSVFSASAGSSCDSFLPPSKFTSDYVLYNTD
jgi:hypothetical protein